MCLTSTETLRLIRDGEKGGRGYGSGERGRCGRQVKVGATEIVYTPDA